MPRHIVTLTEEERQELQCIAWEESAGKSVSESDRRCGSEDMHHSMLGPARRCLTVDHAGNCG